MTTIRRGSPVLNSCGVVIGTVLDSRQDHEKVAALLSIPLRNVATVGISGVPIIRNVTDAEELLGRGAEMVDVLKGPPPARPTCPACGGSGREIVRRFSRRCEGAEVAKCQRCCGTGLRSHEDIAAALDIPWPSEGDDLAHAPPPVDLAAENAALRAALAASGELLADAHAEIERLRSER